ncbi:MAG: hypothetical protein JXR96_09855 [Deltaproteobacteria bacterium]|nr:hypothetical protein [Deltaproteobacteria bacterium]
MIMPWLRAVALFGCAALAGACSPKKLEEPRPDAGAKAKPEPKKRVNPYASMQAVKLGEHKGGANFVGFSPDGSLLVSTGKDKTVEVYDYRAGKLLAELKGHTGDVMMAAFSPDGKKLVSASADESARIWDLDRRKQLVVLKEKPPKKKKLTEEEEAALAALPPPQVNWAAFHPTLPQVITASDDFALKLWDLKTGKKLETFVDEGCRQRRVYRRRDGAGWVSSAGCMDDGVAYLKYWDEAGQLVGSYGNEDRDSHYLAFDRAGRFLVTADGSLGFNVYSVQGSFLKRALVGTYHFCLAFGPGDETLLIGTDGGLVLVFDVESWKRIGHLDVGSKVAVDSLAVNPADESLAVALRDGKVLRFAEPIRLPKKG